MTDEIEEVPEFVDFHYQKSPLYRTIHCDGALGSPTAHGFIALSLYNERTPIPRVTRREVVEKRGKNGFTLGTETPTESLEGVLRHVEATIMMDEATARNLAQWLVKRADEVAQMKETDEFAEIKQVGEE